MATAEQRQELDHKVTALVRARFGGDYRAAFTHYDADGDEVISKSELRTLLSDAGIGNGLTRWAWANGIMEAVDKDGDGHISRAEFDAVFEGGKK